MRKTKSRANGDGDVFPRKNKAGRLPATEAHTLVQMVRDTTSPARLRLKSERRCKRARGTWIGGSSSA